MPYSGQVVGVGCVLEGGVRASRHRHGEEHRQLHEVNYRMNMPALPYYSNTLTRTLTLTRRCRG